MAILINIREFDDFDDITKPSEVYSEVNDLKMKIVQVKPKSLDPETEFEINTKKITQHIVDPETDRILKKFFGDVCPAFLENRCTMPQCQRNHVLLSEAHVYPLIIDAPFDTMKSIFNVTLRFHRLFQSYISIFVEVCIRNKDNAGLIGLVQACDRFPRTITCYKDIVRKLVEKNYMKEHKAISFIIDNHTDSEIARDTILSMILDSGPCLTFFLNYIEKIHLLQPIRMDVFSRILHTCVATQNPKLPYFCLNYLQGCSSSQIRTLNSHYIKTFLEMNKFLSEINENRESKTLLIAEKLLHSGN